MFYEFHIFCCVNERPDSAVRECCMKKKIFDLKLKNIRVNQSGCLDKCESGPVMVIYPEGIWYNYKNKLDIDEIINTHLIKGKVVKRLMLKL